MTPSKINLQLVRVIIISNLLVTRGHQLFLDIRIMPNVLKATVLSVIIALIS